MVFMLRRACVSWSLRTRHVVQQVDQIGAGDHEAQEAKGGSDDLSKADLYKSQLPASPRGEQHHQREYLVRGGHLIPSLTVSASAISSGH
jgi:hypothetical protein